MISFVIRVKNEAKSIGKTLERIIQQKLNDEIEIIIVDSGSEDETVKIAFTYTNKIIQILPEEFTWGKALNLGIESAHGEIIVLLSGHCFLKNNETISYAIKQMEQHNIVAIYGKQVGNIDNDPFEIVELETGYPDIEYFEYGGINENISNIICVSSACCVLKKEIWNIHKFDEKVQSAEDAKWALELSNLGYRMAYTSELIIEHSHPFAASYMYKKWFWRILIYNFTVKKTKNKNMLYYLLYCIYKMNYDSWIYYKRLKKEKIKFMDIFRFQYIKYIAIYNANKMAKKQNWAGLSYSNIKIPRSIIKASCKIEFKPKCKG